jgi:hypothetical protein
MRRAQAVGRVLWQLGNRHGAVRGGVAAAKTVSKAAVRATRILWFEVTGFFFAVFAIWVIGATWNQWEKIRSGVSSVPAWHVAVGVGFSAILIYFSANSFFRARRAAAMKEESSG